MCVFEFTYLRLPFLVSSFNKFVKRNLCRYATSNSKRDTIIVFPITTASGKTLSEKKKKIQKITFFMSASWLGQQSNINPMSDAQLANMNIIMTEVAAEQHSVVNCGHTVWIMLIKTHAHKRKWIIICVYAPALIKSSHPHSW